MTLDYIIDYPETIRLNFLDKISEIISSKSRERIIFVSTLKIVREFNQFLIIVEQV